MLFQRTVESAIMETAAGSGPAAAITLKFVAEPGRRKEPDPAAPGETQEWPAETAADRKAAAKAARDLASKSRAVLLTFPGGESRLYRLEWAGCAPGSYPYRVKCPGCGHYRRYPRG